MSRKRCRRRVIVPVPPRGLRPKPPMLTEATLRDLSMCHLVNLDAIARGEADEVTLWHFVGGTFTFSRIAAALDVGVPEMHQQLELATAVVERYGRTGRAVFTGPEYQLAKTGIEVLDELARIVDWPTAAACAEWGEARTQELADRMPVPAVC